MMSGMSGGLGTLGSTSVETWHRIQCAQWIREHDSLDRVVHLFGRLHDSLLNAQMNAE